jgi:hypothetical protein
LGAAEDERTAGIVVTGPISSGKEQAVPLYAARLAAAGYKVLTFAARNFGEPGDPAVPLRPGAVHRSPDRTPAPRPHRPSRLRRASALAVSRVSHAGRPHDDLPAPALRPVPRKVAAQVGKATTAVAAGSVRPSSRAGSQRTGWPSAAAGQDRKTGPTTPTAPRPCDQAVPQPFRPPVSTLSD